MSVSVFLASMVIKFGKQSETKMKLKNKAVQSFWVVQYGGNVDNWGGLDS